MNLSALPPDLDVRGLVPRCFRFTVAEGCRAGSGVVAQRVVGRYAGNGATRIEMTGNCRP